MPAMRPLINPEVADEMVRKAVEAERERAAAIVAKARCDPDTPSWGNLEECYRMILLIEPEPKPQAPKPMTIEKLMGKLRRFPYDKSYTWKTVEADLTALVQAQARKDADLCFATACPHCWKLILRAADLDA